MRAALLWVVVAVTLLGDPGEAARGGGRRGGRNKGRRPGGSPRFIFYTHPKRKEYYDNPNGAQITKASHFDYEFLLGHKIIFICVAKGDPRPRITWFKDGIEIFAHPYLQVNPVQITEWELDGVHIKSKLEITPARQMDSGTYECMANNKYSIDRRSFKADFNTISR
ncbi:hypothetical protein LAZ67_6000465 [Cordylochernes scorpioides]|uniref:Ig-like domain-containing protein n=1 Tax=Cordylochernes scorpioides TaxID=51811 RepID=A0ABY6KIM2_9ARAC|nr:hypothetical protein LAZ67_6000465 [Cordylochernes scorpioides]